MGATGSHPALAEGVLPSSPPFFIAAKYREDERTPFAMRRDDGTVFGLFYDQIGSLRVVVDIHDNVIKEVQYDPFGGII